MLTSETIAISQQFDAARSAAGIIDLSSEGWIKFSGKDTKKYLHRMTSNEINGLTDGQGTRALYLTAKGRSLSDLRILQVSNEELWAMVPASSFDNVLQKFTLYVIADDVTPSAHGAERALFSVQGPKAEEIARSLGLELGAEDLWHRKTKLDDADIRVVRHDRCGAGGFDVIVAKDSAPNIAISLRKAVEEHGGTAMGPEALESLRIENAVPRFGHEIDERMLPQEAFLEETHISFDKGCYPGQETVAKIHYRGKVNRLMAAFEFTGESPPKVDDEIFVGDDKVGLLTSITTLPDRSVGLGFLKRDFAKADQEIRAGDATGRVRPLR